MLQTGAGNEPIKDEPFTKHHNCETRIQSWGSREVELGSGPRLRNDQEEGHVRQHVPGGLDAAAIGDCKHLGVRVGVRIGRRRISRINSNVMAPEPLDQFTRRCDSPFLKVGGQPVRIHQNTIRRSRFAVLLGEVSSPNQTYWYSRQIRQHDSNVKTPQLCGRSGLMVLCGFIITAAELYEFAGTPRGRRFPPV